MEKLTEEQFERIKWLNFAIYGDYYFGGVKCYSICQMDDVFARAEESGCEGMYVEVAKWNEKNKQWQRYAFFKFLGGEIGDDLSCEEEARIVAEMINKGRDSESFIHNLPDYKEVACHMSDSSIYLKNVRRIGRRTCYKF